MIIPATILSSMGAMSSNGTGSYVIGGIIAFLIMCYLIYSLIRPEKF